MKLPQTYACRMCGHREQCLDPDAPQVIPSAVAKQQAREADRLCSTCDFWSEKERWAAAGRTAAGEPVARVAGQHYVLSPFQANPTQARGLGMGGAVMTFRFTDGRDITSNDVWTQGIIPELWRLRLPDNAWIFPATPTPTPAPAAVQSRL